ncbi:MAG: hypothetical protein WCP45_10755 [Verrucomicrobiota bacterium]
MKSTGAFNMIIGLVTAWLVFSQAMAQPISLTVNQAPAIAPGPAGLGVQFIGTEDAHAKILEEMNELFVSLNIKPGLAAATAYPKSNSLIFTLTTPPGETKTLDLAKRPEFDIKDDWVKLPTAKGPLRSVSTVSKKEIVLALMQHGRTTVFAGENCNMESFKDHVGIRQNIVAWVQYLEWRWPNGGAASWNKVYWNRGTPVPGHALPTVFRDAFLHQKLYVIGCYTATKLSMVHGVLDYYSRIKQDGKTLARIEAALMADGEPLTYIEPAKMWFFEDDYPGEDRAREGKLVCLIEEVASDNFIPGDWAYFLNPDPITCQKTGYEGSNSIYLGRDKFDDYYNEHDHSYSFRQKLDEVYQWRNHVFNRKRDRAKIKPLDENQFKSLTNDPAQGGVIFKYRAVVKQF